MARPGVKSSFSASAPAPCLAPWETSQSRNPAVLPAQRRGSSWLEAAVFRECHHRGKKKKKTPNTIKQHHADLLLKKKKKRKTRKPKKNHRHRLPVENLQDNAATATRAPHSPYRPPGSLFPEAQPSRGKEREPSPSRDLARG